MDEKITIQLAPLTVAPLKKKSLFEMIWEAIGGYVLFFGGIAIGWAVRSLGG